MEFQTFDETLRVFVRRDPFRPFIVKLNTGVQFEVTHPEALAFDNRRGVYLAPDWGLHLFDHGSVNRFIDPPPPL